MQNAEALKDIASTIAQIYFFNQDLQPAFSYIDKDEATWLGLGNSMIDGYDQVIEFLGRHRDRDPECKLTAEEYRVLTADEAHAVLIGRYTFDMLNAMGVIFYIRITYCFVKKEDGWKIIHAHVSSPSYSDYLDKRLRQIQLTTQTVTAGLKGTLNDEKYTFTYVNEEMHQMLGYTREEFMEFSGGTSVGATYPPDAARCCEEVKRALEKGEDYRIEYRMPRKDGTLMWVMDYGKKIRDTEGNIRISSVVMDISDIKNIVSQLQIEKERNEIVAELSGDIVFDYDVNEDRMEIVYPASMNHGTRVKKVVTGYIHRDGWKEMNIREEDNERLKKQIRDNAFQNAYDGIVREEYRYMDQNEGSPWRRVLIRRILDSEGKIARVVGKVFDITSEKQFEMSSITDSLTGAYNRVYLRQEITRYLSEKNNDLYYACMLIDIDYFKEVNDKYGHLQGDEILKRVVSSLKKLFRKTDIVARLGGDEFIVFIKDIEDIAFVEEKAERLLEGARHCYINEAQEGQLSLSIGITISDQNDMDVNALYHQADVALYNAKGQGRGRYMIYRENMEYPAAEEKEI